MKDAIDIYRGRTKIIQVALGYDVSNETITSEIRVDKNPTSELLGTWDVKHATDGIDGELILTLDDAITADVQKQVGWMDMKRLTGGEPINVFDEPLEVHFHNTVTA